MRRIFVLGSINTDLVVETNFIPEKGETLSATDFFIAQGGKGANQAVAAARSGGMVYFCGMIGSDLFGEESLANLEHEGINCSNIGRVNGSSGLAVVVVKDGDNRILINHGANYAIKHLDVERFLSDAKQGDIFVAQLEQPIEVVAYALKLAKEKGMYTILNPAPANIEIVDSLKYVNLITPNENECEALGGISSLLTSVETVVVTLGDKGYIIGTKSGNNAYPCLKVKAIDTTAAGDTFTGALAAKLSEGIDLIEACEYASKAASIACTRKGAQPSIPTKSEVNDYGE